MVLACVTDAAFAILTGNESFVADAVITAVCVNAGTVSADAFLLAFVRFAAFICFFIALHAGRTFAFERADRIDALAAVAKRWNGLALVDICTKRFIRNHCMFTASYQKCDKICDNMYKDV